MPVTSVLDAMPARSETLAVAARDVSKSYGPIRVLKQVSVAIPVGDSRALVGRNGAGKSTLVSILTGITSPTSGHVEFGGQAAPALADRQAWRERVACVYQRWTVIPSLSVAENLFLNNQPVAAGGRIRWREVNERARAVLADWGLDVDPTSEAGRLSVEQRQIVEIGRALLQGSRFIILDEPTAELERREVTRLFDRIKGLQDTGVTFVYISHHLEEIYEICSSVSVLRDGQLVADAPLAEMPRDRLVQAMVGDNTKLLQRGARVSGTSGSPATSALDVRGLTIPGLVQDVSFSIAPGECVGLAGLAGSGKDEIGEVLAGLRVPASGSVTITGDSLHLGQPRAVQRQGIGFVPRDRHVRGNLPQLSIAENVTVTIAETFGRFGFVSPARQNDKARALMRELGVVASSSAQPVSELSGGNQQKCLMARALASKPKVLVLVAPTQGVDIASKNALFGIVAKEQAEGTAVLVISDEVDELSICDRIEILFRGRITAHFGATRDDHQIVAAIEGLGEDQ